MKRWLLVCACWWLLGACQTQAEVTVSRELDSNGTTQVFKLSISPAPEPQPALRYRFSVLPHETIPGNAATHYLRSYGESSLDGPWQFVQDQFGMEVHRWYGQSMPMDEIPLESMRQASEAFDNYIQFYIEPATRCRYCDWGLALEDLSGSEMAAFRLPSVQQSRQIMRTLSLQTRFAVREKRFEDAIDRIRMNYQLARNVAKVKFAVAQLVGLAGESIANGDTLELISSEGSPNLYWALAEQSTPWIDVRDSLRWETQLVGRLLPEWDSVETANHSPEFWNELLQRSFAEMEKRDSYGDLRNGINDPWRRLGCMLKTYPNAKARLIDSGYDPTAVEEMCVAQVLMIDLVRECRRLADQAERSCYVSAEASRSLETDDLQPNAVLSLDLGQLFASETLPASEQVLGAERRISSQRKVLQVIEAIRMHVADIGQMPLSLQDIRVVPVPMNPVSGREFDYQCDGETAVIELRSKELLTNINVRYEIKLKK